jgi:hypothetical protein
MNRCNLISDLTLLRGVPWFVAPHNRVEMPDSGALLMVKGASSYLVAIEVTPPAGSFQRGKTTASQRISGSGGLV